MGFEGGGGGGDGKVLGLKVKPSHKRSMSFPDKKGVGEDDLDSSMEAANREKLDVGKLDCIATKKKQSPKAEVHNSLKQEILHLEKRLQDQFQVRCTLEKALGYRSSNHSHTNDVEMPKPATQLIKEIAVLELEVVHLEQYLLSLYRKAFDGQLSSVSPSIKDERLKSPLTTPRRRLLEISEPEMTSKGESSAVQSGRHFHENPFEESNRIGAEEKLLDSSVHRCHSSLSQRSAFANRATPLDESLAKALRACHSQPLSMMEYAQNASSNVISLAEHLGTRISDHIPETPNRISEDMIKCMSNIYCKLSDPPLTNHGLSSPNSSLSSISAFSPREQSDMWSPGFRNNSSFDVRLDNPFHVEGLKEFSGPYSTMVEVPWIYRDSQKLSDIEDLLQNFRSLISRLEEVDPRKLKHDEKLAFWINIHNALVMHAFLAYGIPQNSVKRVFLLLKAAYNIGGHTISADTIQGSILGCRMSRPGQWLRLLLSPRTKFKIGDDRQAYAIDHSEPLLHFALCSGSHSDPAVRVYTPKRVVQELEAAKEEYIRATFGVRKDQKILLPKIVESFAKDSGLCPGGVLEMTQQALPESLRKSVKKCQGQAGKSRKIIEWIPHNFAFRYLIFKELVK
ncbi:hypothetical protein FNV43_RR17127 [Rhamnella rubrinervis]|uniref:Electron transporter n=1 Tax=Rhamnella rubrinervis TaxID=2594499 RepID=A0A8K0GRL7_9ROSA|nr:hypothetical protein FNV43_RR17127 [Rhamnella rubrinervis]